MTGVTLADVDALRADLTARLKLATVRKRLRILKHLFRQACRAELIDRNPLADTKTTSGANRERMRYVSVEDALAVADELTGEPRLIFLLARFAGMRVPSEPDSLRWEHVDFDNETLRVYAPKTDTTRTVPMLPVVRDELLRAFGELPDGAVGVLQQQRKLPVIRRAIERAAARANVPIWPKVLQQLRASFATDCVRVLPANTAAAVLGHSAQVAAEHYWMCDATDIQRAAYALQHTVELACTKVNSSGTKRGKPAKFTQKRGGALTCASGSSLPMGQTGFIPSAEQQLGTPENNKTCSDAPGTAPGPGAVRAAQQGETPPDLAHVIAAWPHLPADTRRQVLALISSGDGGGG